MINDIEFVVNDVSPAPKDKWIGGYAVKTNIAKRIQKLDYLKFRKWRITLSDGSDEDAHIVWEDEKELNIEILFSFSQIENCKTTENISKLYSLIFKGLEQIWVIKNWNVNDLLTIHKAIIDERYEVFAVYGKSVPSPNKKYNAELFSQLFPEYSENYLQIVDKKGTVLRKVKFLKGHLSPEMFLGFFTARYWKDNESFSLAIPSKEVSYNFNIHSDDYKVEYEPVDTPLEELRNYVRAFHSDVTREEMLHLLKWYLGKS